MPSLLLALSWLNFAMQATEPASNKNLDFLFAGFTVVWLLLLGYILSLSRRQKRLEAEIEMLKQMKQER
ncbi:CcmD family protein [candidate division KSB1 bacterium]|nr:CcmD family protein [candidate division KSB1 bacterium]